MDFFYMNKLSELHDGKKIIFCKTDFLHSEFETISKLNNEVILISGNSDYPITDDFFDKLPNNVNYWFAQNAICAHQKILPIPLGLENKTESLRIGHGIGYFNRVEEKENLIDTNNLTIPNKLIYSNFDVNTNLTHRLQIKNISIECNHINWENNNLSMSEYYRNVLEHKMIVCPAGNGVDTHRLWEVLYLERIPITIKLGNYKIYELYEKLPIILLDNPYDLLDLDKIMLEYERVKNNIYDLNLLNYTFWKNKILNLLK